jgi:hypothetical protein
MKRTSEQLEKDLISVLSGANFTCIPSLLVIEKPTLCVRKNDNGKQEVLTIVPVFKDGVIIDYCGTLIVGNQLFEVNFHRLFVTLEQIEEYYSYE